MNNTNECTNVHKSIREYKIDLKEKAVQNVQLFYSIFN